MVLRPLRPSDAAAVAAFFGSCHRLDPSIRPISRARWRAFVAYPTNRGGRDFAVAVEGRRVLGVLTSTLLEGRRHGRTRRHLRVVVHPEFRRRGIGGALLERAVRQELPGPRPTLQAVCHGSWKQGIAFLRHRGFRVVFRDLELDRPPLPVGVVPIDRGTSIRPLGRRGDVDAWIRLHDAGFREEFHFEPLTRAAVRVLRRLPGFRARVAVRGGRVVGLAYGHRASGTSGSVDSMLVAASHRRKGLGRALLRAVLRSLRRSGCRETTLSVEAGNGAARALYAAEGFRVRDEDFTLWKEVRPAVTAPRGARPRGRRPPPPPRRKRRRGPSSPSPG